MQKYKKLTQIQESAVDKDKWACMVVYPNRFSCFCYPQFLSSPSLPLWRYSSPARTQCCAACSGWPCFGRRLGWV